MYIAKVNFMLGTSGKINDVLKALSTQAENHADVFPLRCYKTNLNTCWRLMGFKSKKKNLGQKEGGKINTAEAAIKAEQQKNKYCGRFCKHIDLKQWERTMTERGGWQGSGNSV